MVGVRLINPFWEYVVYKILDISGLTTSESILIKANFEYLYRLQCDAKIDEQVRRGYPREVAESAIRKEHGCGVLSATPVYQIDNIKFNTCPCAYRHPHMDFFLQTAHMLEQGILPYPGALIDQPAYIIEATNLIGYLRREYQAEEQKKAHARAKRSK